nr:MAG TPA: hypothetical protein [Caudoviricetes sp.]
MLLALVFQLFVLPSLRFRFHALVALFSVAAICGLLSYS